MTLTHRSAVWIALAFGAGCGSGSITEIFACYSFDPSLVSEDTIVRMCVRDEEGQVVQGCGDARLSLANTGITASQGFVRDDAERLLFELEGEVSISGRVISFSQLVDVPFVEGEIIDVSLRLDIICADRICDLGSTCVAGSCEAIDVGTRCLTPHGLAPLPECTDPRLVTPCNAPPAD